jgi:hypothetical protein
MKLAAFHQISPVPAEGQWKSSIFSRNVNILSLNTILTHTVASLLHLPDGDHVIAGTITLNQLTDGSNSNNTNASNYCHSYQ